MAKKAKRKCARIKNARLKRRTKNASLNWQQKPKNKAKLNCYTKEKIHP